MSVVTALWPRCGLAQGATGGVGGARVQRAGLASSTGYTFAGPGAPQAQADRINVLLRLEHGSVVRVEAPHPGVTDLRVAKFQPRVGAPGALVLVLEQPVLDAHVNAGGGDAVDLRALACKGAPRHHRHRRR